MSLPSLHVRDPLTLASNRNAPPDIVALVQALLETLGLQGAFRLRVRGLVTPREGYDDTGRLFIATSSHTNKKTPRE